MNRLIFLALCLTPLCSPSLLAASPTPSLELLECRLDRGSRLSTVKARCGQLQVAENPEDPNGAQIALAVARVPSLNIQPEPDPLVILSGGPGQSAIDFYLGYRGAFEAIRLERDIILMDQRGTGESNALTCDAVNDISDPGEDDEALKEATRACISELNGDPRYYTTSVAVRDLDLLRQALGTEQWNLYGISYGTRVAQHYMRRYPDSTRRVILDGVVHPQLALGPAISTDAQATLDRIFASCREDTHCNERFPDLNETFLNLKQRLKDNPRDIAINDPKTGKLLEQRLSDLELGAVVRLMSYAPSTIALLPLIIDSAYGDQNYQPLAARARELESTLTESLSIGMHNAVVCTEDAPFYEAMTLDLDAIEATYLGGINYRSIKTMCSEWPQGLLDENFKDPLETDIPVLLLSGENDPVTPPAYADAAAAGLRNSQHLTGRMQGHGMAPLGCVPRVMANFIKAESDPLPVSSDCVEDLAVMPFFVDFSGPAE
ncbi:MAG: alpha/beta fold hydrolase [Pseudomonadota bacterium]